MQSVDLAESRPTIVYISVTPSDSSAAFRAGPWWRRPWDRRWSAGWDWCSGLWLCCQVRFMLYWHFPSVLAAIPWEEVMEWWDRYAAIRVVSFLQGEIRHDVRRAGAAAARLVVCGLGSSLWAQQWLWLPRTGHHYYRWWVKLIWQYWWYLCLYELIIHVCCM